MQKGDELRKSMPKFIEELERKIEVHNADAAPFCEHPPHSIENQLLNAERLKIGGVTTSDLEEGIVKIEMDVGIVRGAFEPWSNSIAVDQYLGIVPKADCCPTFRSMLSEVWLG